jgi:hypothetical protein
MHLSAEQKVIGGIILLTIILVVGGAFLLSGQENKKSSIPEDQIVSRNGIHWHTRLKINIDGEKQDLSENIGLGAVHQKMHTHLQDYKDGVVHIEIQGAVAKEDTRVGNFFRIWGKEFSSTQIFDKFNGTDGKVKMLVNGEENTEFENYEMKDDDKIEIIYE